MPIWFVTNLISIGQLSTAYYIMYIASLAQLCSLVSDISFTTALRLCEGGLRRDLGCTGKVVPTGVCRCWIAPVAAAVHRIWGLRQSLVAPVLP